MATETILFQDDFSTNGRMSSVSWDYNHWSQENNPSFIGQTQMRQELPFQQGGMARIRLDTWLDKNAFLGSEAITIDKWDVQSGGLAFDGRFRYTETQGGMITGFFTYEYFPAGSNRAIHDEIDYEILTTQLHKISTNVFAHESANKNPLSVAVAENSLAAFQNYRMEWTPSAVRWLINGVQVRIETDHIPTQPSQVHLNLWGVPQGWGPSPGDPDGPPISDPNFTPAQQASDNKTYFFDVGQVKVSRMSSVFGGAAADTLVGGETHDVIDGAAGHDILNGMGGDDTLIGAAGDDTIDGGDGSDTAIYGGIRSSYGVGHAGMSTTIADTRAESPDGMDTLKNVEWVQFADGLYSLGTDGVLTLVPQTIGADPARTELVLFGDAYTILQGQSLTVTAQDSVLFNDVSDDGLTASLAQGPSHGTVQFNSDGTFSYNPNAGFSGVDSFDYRATDIHGAFGVQSVLIQVAPTKVGATTTLDLVGLTPEQAIATMYTGFVGRGADAAGFTFWVQQYWNGIFANDIPGTILGIAGSFGASAEAKGLYPFLAHPAGSSDAEIGAFVNEVYENLFSRTADAGGKAYWTGEIKQLVNAGQAPGAVLANIMSGAQNVGANQDITTLLNKAVVNVEYAVQQIVWNMTWSADRDGASAAELMRDVTSDVQSALVGMREADLLVIAHAP